MVTLLIVHTCIVCLFLIVIVLLQHGKGADIGATFGGSSQSLFGTEGPMPLLNKITTFAAIVFMLTSVTLAYFSSSKSTGSVMSNVKVQERTSADATGSDCHTDADRARTREKTHPREQQKNTVLNEILPKWWNW